MKATFPRSLSNYKSFRACHDVSNLQQRLSWYNADEIGIQCLRALPNRDKILNNDIFIEAVRCILGLPSHILQPFADEQHFIGRNAMEKRVAEIETHYTKRAKKLDATFAAGNNSNPFLSAYKSYGIN